MSDVYMYEDLELGLLFGEGVEGGYCHVEDVSFFFYTTMLLGTFALLCCCGFLALLLLHLVGAL